MKGISIQAAFFLAIFPVVGSLRALADGGAFPAPELTKILSENVFVPQGFDDNDNVQLIVHGQLINTCYKAAPPLVEVDRARHLITVSAQSYVYSGCWCLEVLAPITQTVDLGLLPAGKYRVVESDLSGRLIHDVSLPVAVSASAAPDDLLYAPVKQARLESSTTNSKKTLVLSGAFSSSCLEMQEVKVLSRTPHILEVLPIAAYKAGSDCKPKTRPFEVRVNLPSVEPGDTLVYVRSLNGQAISLVEPF